MTKKITGMALILMADIVESSKHKNAKKLMTEFKDVVSKANVEFKTKIASQLTITLGDEFQGVIRDVTTAVNIIFRMEEHLLKSKNHFKLRFIINEGSIETKINKEKSYEMLGPGLTRAREMINELKSKRQRININLNDSRKSDNLNLAFHVYQGIADQWTDSQRKVVSAFLELGDYREVAKRLKKDASVIWRRKQSLMIEEYDSLKKLIVNVL